VPTFSSLAAYGREIQKMATEFEREERRRITRKQAEAAQKIAESAARADLGSDRKFTNWAPVADTKITLTRNDGHLMTPTKPGAGVWTVAEFGRNSTLGPRMVGPRLTQTGRVSRRKVKRWNGRTAGMQTASDAIKRMERELPKVADEGVRRVLRKHFDVT